MASLFGNNKKTPNQRLSTRNPNDINFYYSQILTEKEKFADDKEMIKRIVLYNETVGKRQMTSKRKRINKLRCLADGVLNTKEFINDDAVSALQKIDPSIKLDEESLDLEFFGIIPPIVNRLLGEIQKKHFEFEVDAVGEFASNELIEKRNSELQDMMIKELTKKFKGEDNKEAETKIKGKVDQYQFNYRLDIAEWANHVVEFETQKFNTEEIFNSIFKEKLINDEPYIHINYINEDYYPEIIKAEDCYSVCPKNTDVSEGTVFGWEIFENLNTIINKYTLTEENLDKLKEHTQIVNGNGGFVPDGNIYSGSGHTQYTASRDNMIFFNEEVFKENDSSNPYDQNKKFRVSTQYFYIPKKIGVLTTVINNEFFSTTIDESFVVTEKPEYKNTTKSKENLIKGEHIEWHYINELWKSKKIDVYGQSFYNYSLDKNETDTTIWLELKPNDIQYKHKFLTYGLKIPVHGGRTQTNSWIEGAEVWQKFYNYLGNRCKQLMSDEIGSFLMLNQNSLPSESMNETWGANNLIKAFLTAKELSILPTDTSLTNMGQMAAGNGFGQLIDLNKTKDVIDKLTLMRTFKEECLQSLGLNSQFMNDISEYQSAKSVAQSKQSTITQLQYLFTGHLNLVRRVRETMLETVLYLTSKGLYTRLDYVNSEQQRIIFSLEDTSTTLLYDLALFPKNSINDIINHELIEQLILTDNTMGASLLEKAEVIDSKSHSAVIKKLKVFEVKKQKREDQQREHETKMQDEQLKAQQEMLDKKLANDNSEKQKDRENSILEKQIAAIGYGQSTADEISKEVIEMANLSLKKETHNLKRDMYEQTKSFNEKKLEQDKIKYDDEVSYRERIDAQNVSERKRENDRKDKDTYLKNKKTENK